MTHPMSKRIPFLYGLAAAAVFFCGCRFPERPPEKINTFRLTVSTPNQPSPVQTPYCVSVRPCRAAPAFRSKVLIYRVGEAEYQKDFYNQLLSTPAESITQSLSDWITSVQWTPCLPGTAPKDFYTITPVLDEIYGDFRDGSNPFAVVKMQLSLTLTDSKCRCVKTLVNKPYEARVLMGKWTIRELVVAYSKALEKIFADFQKDAEAALGNS